MNSIKWQLNEAEAKAVIKNALIFLAPVAITLLTMFSNGVTNIHLYAYTFEVWATGVALDYFRKLQAGK